MFSVFNWWHPHRRKRHHHHHAQIVLLISVEGEGYLGLIIQPGRHVTVMIKVTVGHKLACTIGFLDQNGNPMLAVPKVDAVPTWSNTTPATETLIAAADGLSASASTLAVGTDAISLALAVGGVAFTASLAVEVDAVPQTLTSVAINAVAS
jgi:hypothetical protein